MEALPSDRGVCRDRATSARTAFVLTALAAFLPAIPGWALAYRYGRIPRWPVATLESRRDTGPGAPPLLGAAAIAAAPDGTLIVSDRVHRRVVAIPPSGSPRWLPPTGRFEVGFDPGGRLHLLDIDAGVLFRFSAAGGLDRRLAVAEPGSSPVFCIAPDGRVLVAAGGAIRRLSEGLDAADASWGASVGTVRAGGIVALAASSRKVYAVSRSGLLSLFSADGDLVGRRRILGNAGPIAVAPDGRLVLADRSNGRLFVLDAEGRTVGRLVGADGTAPVANPGGLAFVGGERLAVASGGSVDLLSLPGGP